MQTISDTGLQLIKDFEGLRLEAYICPAGVWTIGYGHVASARAGMVITEAEADELLVRDVAGAEEAVRQNFAGLTQNQFDALVSWTFNLGAGNLRSSTMRRKILEGAPPSEIARQIRRWNKARVGGALEVLPGLVRRREAEAKLYTTGVYP